jgi:hypothetical protein
MVSISKHLDRGQQSLDLSQMPMISCSMQTSEINVQLREDPALWNMEAGIFGMTVHHSSCQIILA